MNPYSSVGWRLWLHAAYVRWLGGLVCWIVGHDRRPYSLLQQYSGYAWCYRCRRVSWMDGERR